MPTPDISLAIRLIWEQEGLDQIVAQAGRALKQMAASPEGLTPERIQSVASTTVGAVRDLPDKGLKELDHSAHIAAELVLMWAQHLGASTEALAKVDTTRTTRKYPSETEFRAHQEASRREAEERERANAPAIAARIAEGERVIAEVKTRAAAMRGRVGAESDAADPVRAAEIERVQAQVRARGAERLARLAAEGETSASRRIRAASTEIGQTGGVPGIDSTRRIREAGDQYAIKFAKAIDDIWKAGSVPTILKRSEKAITQVASAGPRFATAEHVQPIAMAAQGAALKALGPDATIREAREVMDKIATGVKAFTEKLLHSQGDLDKVDYLRNPPAGAEYTARADLRQAKREDRARETLVRAGEPLTGAAGQPLPPEQLVARAAALEMAAATRRRAEAWAALTPEEIAASVQQRAEQATFSAAIRAREKAYIKDAIDTGQLGGTRFQKLVGRATGQVPEGLPTLGESFKTKLATTAQYGVSGLLAGGALFAIKDMIKEAEAFERTMTLLQSQLEAIGQGNQFDGLRNQIKGIARETGQSANDTGQMFSRLVGVFADPGRAIRETDSAMKIMTVTGLSLQDGMQQLVPIMTAFDVSAEEVGDSVLGIQEQFGVAPTAMISFLSRVSATADSAGLSLRQLEVIGGTMANAFGGNLDTAAEQFNRFLPQLDSMRGKLLTLLRARPSTEGLVAPLVTDFAKGETGKALFDLIKGYDQLSEAQKKVVSPSLVRSIANPKQAPFITELLERSRTIVEQGSLDAGAADVDKLEHKFADLQATVGGAQKRISETFSQMGDAIFESGIAEVFTEIGSAIQGLLAGLNAVVGVFGAINNATKPLAQIAGFKEGFLGPFVSFIAVAALVTKGLDLIVAALRGTTVAKVEDTVSTGVNTGSLELNTAARARAVIALQIEANNARAAALAEELDAVATAENAGAQTVNTGSRARAAIAADIEANSVRAAALAEEADAAATAENSLAQGGGAAARAGGLLGRLTQGSTGFGLKNLLGKLTGGGAAAAGGGVAAGEGAAVAGGAGLVPVAGMVIAAGLTVNKVREGYADDLQKQSSDLREKLKKLNDDQLHAIASDNMSIWDRVSESLFGVDFPQTLAKQLEFERSPSKPFVEGLLATGKVQEFTKRLSDQSLKAIEDYFALDENQDLGTQLGLIPVDTTGATSGMSFGAGPLPNAPPGAIPDKPRRTIKAQITRENLPEAIRTAEERAAKDGDEASRAFLDRLKGIRDLQGGFEDLDKAVDDALKSANFSKALDELGPEGWLASTMQGLESQRAAGELTTADYIVKAKAILEVDKSLAQGEQDPTKKDAAMIAVNNGIAQVSQAVNQQMEARLTMLSKLGEMSGDPNHKAADLQRRLAAYSTYTTPQERFAALPKLLDDAKAAEEERIRNIIDPIERNRAIAEGYEIDVKTRSGIIEEDLSSSLADQPALQDLATALETTGPLLNQALADEAARTGKSVREIALGMLKVAAGVELSTNGMTQHYKDLIAEEERINGQLGGIALPGTKAFLDPKEAAKKAAADESAIRQANFALAAARVSKDPVAVARLKVDEAQQEYSAKVRLRAAGLVEQIEVTKAETEMVLANQGLADAFEAAAKIEAAREESRFAIQEAIDEKDPGKTALNALAKANRALAHAQTEEERNQAIADQIRAQHGIEDYIVSVFDSQIDLAIAVAEAGGHTVEAARLASERAKGTLQIALARGADPNGPDVNAMRSDVVAKGAALRDATLNEKTGHIEFLQQMGQLTTGQVIAAYTELLQYPGATQPFIEEIELKIHQLQQTAKADYQFNLPSTLTLPTFYEARRATQTPGGPGAYTDNRQVAISINVGTQADLAQVESVIAQHVGVDRYSAANKRYAG